VGSRQEKGGSAQLGKIFDALERHKKEKSLGRVERLPVDEPEKQVEKGPELPSVRKLVVQSSLNPKLVVSSAPDSMDAENFKILRTQILFPKDGKRPRTILITSSFPGEGKTFVAANLAVSIAQSIDEYVLLMDCDLRRPKAHNMLGLSNTEGLHEYLTGKKDLSDLLIRTRFEKLSLLSAGSPSPNPSELLLSTRMKDLFKQVKGRNQDRFIIIDAPPTQITAEAAVLANYTEGIIFVVMAGKSPRATIQRNIEDLGKAKIMGIVFNGYSKSYKFYNKYYKKYYK
jgi:exopolysaccharide/PEP-CTERM locus tyrosine autokinase